MEDFMIILVGDQLAQCACNCRLRTSVKVQFAIYFLTAINKQLQIAIIIGTLRQTPKRKKTGIAEKSLYRTPSHSLQARLGVRYRTPRLLV